MRRSVMRSGTALALVGMAALLSLISIGFCIFGAYQYLLTITEPVLAAFITGGITFMFSLVILWIGIQLGR
ncbi:hypothetical protein N9235_01255 [Gammaproteobacteria bacterium]|nr:hypothetical protein [Gammaproteobacteria bacterium]